MKIIFPTYALGTWAMGGGESWGPSDRDESIRTIHRALELGYTFIDTAPAYGSGLSEELLGEALVGKRDSCILATKCGLIWGEHDQGFVHMSRDGMTVRRNLSKASIKEQVEESLRRLKTDHFDLLLTHWPAKEPFLTPVAETVEAFEELIQEGKIRSYGACNVDLPLLKEYKKWGSPAVIQNRYSLLHRIDEEIISYCEEEGIVFQAYSPLERGLLSGRVGLDTPIEGRAKQATVWFEKEKRADVLDLLSALEAISATYQVSVANIILAWTAQVSKAMNVLVGARKVWQVEENSKALTLTLTEDDWNQINSLAKELL